MKHLPLFALCLGSFMVIMDITIVNVALPSIGLSLHTSTTGLEWIVNAYTISFASLLLTAGHLGDRYGEKQFFIAGLGIFALSSLCCGLSDSIVTLSIFRFVQGLSAALIVPTSLSLLSSIYPDKHSRARAIGIWGGISGLAAASGPILGALLTASLSWRYVFFVNIPIGIAALALTLTKIQSEQKVNSSCFDLPGFTTGLICIAALSCLLIESGHSRWVAAPIVLATIIFLASLVLFILVEMRSTAPMLPLSLLRNHNLSWALTLGVLMNLSFYGELFILPLYFEKIRMYSVLKTGLALFPLVATVAIASYLSGKVAAKTHPKWPILVGLGSGATGYLCLLSTGSDKPGYLLLAIPLLLIGFGLAFTMPSATLIALNSVSERSRGLASGTFSTSRQIGSLVGVALFGSIVSVSKSFVPAMHTTLILAAIVYVIAAVGTMVVLKS